MVEGPNGQGASDFVQYYDKDCSFSVHKLTKSWQESDAKWENLNNAHEPVVLDTFVYKKGFKGWIHFDVTSAIKDFLKDPSKNFGFIIRNTLVIPDNLSGNMSEFWSSEAKDVTLRPKLSIYTDNTKLYKNKMTSSAIKNVKIYQQNNQILLYSPMQNSNSLEIYTSSGKNITNALCKKINNEWYAISKQNSQSNVVFLQIKNTKGTEIIKLYVMK